MLITTKPLRPSAHVSQPRAPAQSSMGRILSRAVRVVVLAGSYVVAVFAFAFAAASMLLLGVYLWWKTRELRRFLRAQTQEERIIDGEVIRDSNPHYSVSRGTQSKSHRPPESAQGRTRSSSPRLAAGGSAKTNV